MMAPPQYVASAYATQLLNEGTAGRGYLLKDRTNDLDSFAAAIKAYRRRRLSGRPRGRLRARRTEPNETALP
jgi:hypothetical protein